MGKVSQTATNHGGIHHMQTNIQIKPGSAEIQYPIGEYDGRCFVRLRLPGAHLDYSQTLR